MKLTLILLLALTPICLACDVQVIDPIADYFLREHWRSKVVDNLKFPDLQVDAFQLLDIKVGGLDTVHRACETKVHFNSATRHMNYSACSGVLQVGLAGKIRVHVPVVGWKTAGRVVLYLRDVTVQMSGSVPLKRGEWPRIHEVKIAKFGKFYMDGTGLLAGFDWIITKIMNSSLQKNILVVIEKNALRMVQERLNEIIL